MIVHVIGLLGGLLPRMSSTGSMMPRPKK